ncbi:hypothetical protein GSF08_05745 [Clostridiaceae bacterium DONG20-135]|uniref:Dockerin domain-containing protein n=1 Tax=Copranaerobaculum intestinale TaxID=2692629 RepID=A0A6N8U5T9_9FIRM|nr:glucosaminidase domain-containing protein [Copranaerobaculum intestinale]MXQ73432.1 hypothetical protein [Copranaerobaculum intestinale]
MTKIWKMGTVLFLGAALLSSFAYPLHAEDSVTGEGTIIDVDEHGNVSFIEPKENDISEELKKQYENTDTYEVVSTIGNYKQVIGTYDSFEEAKQMKNLRSRMRSTGDVTIEGNGLLRDVQYGTVDFKTKANTSTTTYYQNADKSGVQGYLNGNSASDGAYLGTNADGSMVKFKMSGVTAWVSINDVVIRDFNNSYNSYYKIYDATGYLCHYVSFQADSTKGQSYSGGIVVGKAPSYLKRGTYYYSYDGIYFYTDYSLMINDYKNGVSTHAVNADSPYYNYFQYLPFRTKTNFTAGQLNQLVITETHNNAASKLMNTGSLFINQQNKYGVNAAMMLSGGAIESAWGTSSYAVNRNNLFGHMAYDSDPDNAANYATIEDGIAAHAKTYLSDGYLNPKDSRYFGPQFGNKNGGINFKYASDPNLGEKYASIMYDIEFDNGEKNIDYGKYTIGIVNGWSLNVRKEATTSSKALYQTSPWGGQPVVILGKVSGQAVNGNTTWYKIQSDAVLTSDRSAVQGIGNYDFDRDYGYVSAEYVDVIYNNGNIPNTDPEPTPDPNYKLGDVNNDGKISTMDYVLVKNHILQLGNLTGKAAIAADVNKDGKISTMDYVLIKNHILGISHITE